jgi:hypothetical protein
MRFLPEKAIVTKSPGKEPGRVKTFLTVRTSISLMMEKGDSIVVICRYTDKQNNTHGDVILMLENWNKVDVVCFEQRYLRTVFRLGNNEPGGSCSVPQPKKAALQNARGDLGGDVLHGHFLFTPHPYGGKVAFSK